MRDSTAELQITLCWFPPVAGLKGVKLRPSVSDLAAGFSIAPSWYGQRCPPRGGTSPRSPLPALWCRVWDERCFPRSVLEGTMLCPVFPHVLWIRFH